ncbi:SGNH/GDSL hydrolase family protein [Companilactobacillus heilongjiangensis]|uniref:SGNH hydrolase-type esterase domain-containing protein n=1 Tax=Companilactobacillus heilongjiangensis TaxID=1074467 RepID=A0A0K2LF11_9LACO|nr:SGNH/GDSL hydrolase family protein [Companilactobacillus heilongjiangensis]ALB29773.1 hypothetical protein JP39_10655 [Companilactobacillus heilongjiangensis]
MKKIFILVTMLIVLISLIDGCANKTHVSTSDKNKTEIKQVKKKELKRDQNKFMLTDLRNSKKKSLVYYALGDSLSVGLFSKNLDSNFTTLFNDYLKKGTGKEVTEVNNSSVGKTVTNFGLPNVQNLINHRPDIVTIEFGTNDSAYGVDYKNLRNFTNNLDTLVRRIKNETDAQILLMTTWSPSNGKYIDNDLIYDRKIKDIGKKYAVTVVDLSTIWKHNPKVTENDLVYSQVYHRRKDQFHPNQSGHDEIAKLLYKTVKTK